MTSSSQLQTNNQIAKVSEWPRHRSSHLVFIPCFTTWVAAMFDLKKMKAVFKDIFERCQ